MAGILGHVVSGECTVTSATAKTILQLVAATNHRVLIKGFTVSFKGTSATDSPILVQILRQTTAGTSSAATMVKNNSADDETLQTTGRYDCSAEPTASDILMISEVHPQSGWQVFFPLGQEIVIPGGGRVGIKCTPSATPTSVSATADFIFEE